MRLVLARAALLVVVAALAVGCGSSSSPGGHTSGAKGHAVSQRFAAWKDACNLDFLKLTAGPDPYNTDQTAANAWASQYCSGYAAWQSLRILLWEFWTSEGKWRLVQASHVVARGGSPVGPGNGDGSGWLHAVAPRPCDSFHARRYHSEIESVVNTQTSNDYDHHTQNYPGGSGVSLDCKIDTAVALP